jgi:hypothetical protein
MPAMKPMSLADLNHFRVTHTDASGKHPRLTGLLSLPGQLAPGDYVALFLGLANDDLRGELVEVDPDAAIGVISVTFGSIDALVGMSAGIPIYDGYWSDRVRLVIDDRLIWARHRFTAPDAFVEPAPQGGTMWRVATPEDVARTDGKIVPGGWDHEHCDICWAKIGAGGDPEGYSTPDDHWVCVRCYEQHIACRDLSFVLGRSATGDEGEAPTAGQQVVAEIDPLINAYDLGAIEEVLKSFGSPDPRNRYGWTPLMVAASRDHRSLASLLLSRGADLNAIAESGGYTPLALAAQKGYVEMAQMLLNAGANTQVSPTLCGGSLLTHVKSGRGANDPKLFDLLRSAGAT